MGRLKIKKDRRWKIFSGDKLEKTLNVQESAEMTEILERQKALFIDKFGREPGPNDPVFFDSDCASPTPISEKKVTSELRAAIDCAGLGDRIDGLSDDEVWDMLMESFRRYPELRSKLLSRK